MASTHSSLGEKTMIVAQGITSPTVPNGLDTPGFLVFFGGCPVVATSLLNQYEHSTGTRRFNYRLTG